MVNSFYKDTNLFFLKWAFVYPAKLSSGLLSSGILSSGLLSQWAFVRSPHKPCGLMDAIVSNILKKAHGRII